MDWRDVRHEIISTQTTEGRMNLIHSVKLQRTLLSIVSHLTHDLPKGMTTSEVNDYVEQRFKGWVIVKHSYSKADKDSRP